MTDYKGPNAFSSGLFKPAKAPKIIPPYQRSPGGVVRNTDGPAFNNRFPKSRYRGGGQSSGGLESSGGEGDYVAKAVHFDGSSYLENLLLNSTNSATCSMSVWLKMDASGNVSPVLASSDATNNAQWEASLIAGSGVPGSKDVYMTTYDISTFASLQVEFSDDLIPGESYFHLLWSADVGYPEGEKRYALYITDVLATPEAPSDTGDAFVTLFNNLPFRVGGDSTGPNDGLFGDMADFWFAPGVSLLDGGGLIPEATRRQFISETGKPVDPENFPAGAVVLFSGDADTFGTNQGTGGSFTLSGSLTNATTSPSDP